jgi:hypothetical protein
MTDLSGSAESKASTAIVLASDVAPIFPATDCREITLVGKPHPLKTEVFHSTIREGMNISQILEGLDSNRLDIRLNGWRVPQDLWHLVKPKAGTTLEIVAYPQGGSKGGKLALQILGALAIVVLSVVSYGVLSGPLGTTFAGIIAASISVLGNLALNALIKLPKDDSFSDSSSGTANPRLTGVGNRANPYGTIPLVIGEYVIFPPLAAGVFSVTEGDQQFVNLLFDFGQGDLLIDQLKFGSTNIETFGGDVVYEVGGPSAPPMLYRNDVDEAEISYPFEQVNLPVTRVTATNVNEIGVDFSFPQGLFGVNSEGNIYPGTTQLKVEVRAIGEAWVNTASLGEFTSVGWKTAKATATNTNTTAKGSGATAYWEVSSFTKIPFTTGLVIVPPKDFTGRQFEIQVTLLATEFGLTEKSYNHIFNEDHASPIPIPLNFEEDPTVMVVLPLSFVGVGVIKPEPLLPADYTVSGAGNRYITLNTANLNVQRVNSPTGIGGFVSIGYKVNDTRALSKAQAVTWSTLRSTTYRCPSTTPTTKIAMKLRASEELKGNVNQLSGRVRQRIHVYSGLPGEDINNHETWALQPSRNPAWIYYWLLTECPANPRLVDSSRVDVLALYSWAQYCDSYGFVYSSLLDSSSTLGQILIDVCAAGRATFCNRDGKYSIVRDVQQSAPVQYFTPNNSSGFTGTRMFPDKIHCLICKFPNPAAGYQEDECRVYDQNYSDATPDLKTEAITFSGIPSPDAIWRLARYHLAVSRLRQNEYTWKTDIEHIVCQRGDLVKFNHDVVNWGSGFSRIKSIVGSVITLDEPITLSDGTYTLRVRKQDGTSVAASCTYSTPGVFIGSLPGAYAGDLAMIGTVGQESVNLIITKITPGQDLVATISAVDEAPEVYSVDTPVPAGWFNSTIAQPYHDPPNPPSIKITNGESIGTDYELDIVVFPGVQYSNTGI